MHIPHQAFVSPAGVPNLPARRRAAFAWRPVAAAVLSGLAASAQAIDFGPFSLTGFAKAEFTRGSNQCPDCAVNPGEDKQKIWADPLIPGSSIETRSDVVTLVQPYLGAKFDLPGGFKLGGLLSKRWRDGKEDIPGFWWDKSVNISHEDYGRLAVGAMLSRSWSLADYPFGSDIGLSSPWASSGAGYGLLGHAVRCTSRPLDVSVGDLVLEATYDRGASGWKKNKPRFLELYAQFYREGLIVDLIYQDSRNGTPSAWGQGPVHRADALPARRCQAGRLRPEHCDADGALAVRPQLGAAGWPAPQPLERCLCPHDRAAG